MTNPDITLYYFEQYAYIPNHPYLPVLHYKGALVDKEEIMEEIFYVNNWRNSWVNGVFDFHHYHSNTHEVLGVKKGSALLVIGGERGSKVVVNSGDILLLPAGTGHKKISASKDFKVVGAYPSGQEYNLKKDTEEDLIGAVDDIKNALFPKKDPVYGEQGPLFKMWKRLK